MLIPWLTGLLLLAAVEDDRYLQNVRDTEPQTAEQQSLGFHVPAGFEVRLVAAEPDIPKPMNLAFDARGRLWVSGSLEYPYPAGAGQGRDSIRILTDDDGDGRADRITPFVEGLNIPMGLYPYRDGVVVYSIDRIDFWRDTDGDDRADTRELLYGPLGQPVDTHGMQNAFRRGLDGWLYINHGFANQTTIKGRDGSKVTLHSGNTYRVRLDGSRVEQFTWGQVNPFGSAWTEAGDLITADCHSKPLTLLLRGAYYSSFGKPHDGLGFAPELMSHHHGSTGLAGVAYYADGDWPAEYRESLFIGNVVTSRVHRDLLKFRGATPRAEEQADFLTCDDPWFRPVDMRFGPDGALYIADFYNRIIGHYEVPLDHPGRDRQRGRIWKVVYRGSTVTTSDPAADDLDLSRATIAQLIAALEHPALTRRLLAVDQLSDRYGLSAVEPLRQAIDAPETSSSTWRSRALSAWVLLRVGALRDADLQKVAADTSALARMHAMRMVAEQPQLSPIAESLAVAGLSDADASVRRTAADALGQHPRPTLVKRLLDALANTDPGDVALRHSLRLSLRNQLRDEMTFRHTLAQTWSATEQEQLADIALAVPTPLASRFVLDYLDHHQPDDEQLAKLLQHAARHLSGGTAEQLARIARERAGHDVTLSVALYQTVTHAMPSQAAADSFVTQWGRELAEQLINQIQESPCNWTAYTGSNPWGHENRQGADGQTGVFLSSLPGGERNTGRLVSATFLLPARLSFDLCGHRGDPQAVRQPPGDARREDMTEIIGDNYVQLRLAESGQVVRRVFPPRNDRARQVDWDLSAWRGQSAVLEVVDNLDATAYAWLAVARFQPPVIAVPRRDPREVAAWQRMAAELIDVSTTPQHASVLRDWIRQGADWTSRAAAAVALCGHQQPAWQALGRAMADNSLPDTLREEIASQFTPGDDPTLKNLLVRVFQHLTQPQQEAAARQLASSTEGAAMLLVLIQNGQVNNRLLQRPALREQLRAAHLEGLDAQIERIVATLPPENDRVVETIQQARDDFRSSPEAIESGKALFAKHCSTCHQLQGQGNLVGPQLDGIGNRGLDRVAEDMLAPYRNVDVAFRTTLLSLHDGRVLSGLVRQKADDRWLLVNSEGKEVAIATDIIEESQASPLSIMPDNFSQVLTPQERNDLLAFLSSQK